MKTEQEIKAKIEWLRKALSDEENRSEIVQIKLHAQLDALEWVVNNGK